MGQIPKMSSVYNPDYQDLAVSVSDFICIPISQQLFNKSLNNFHIFWHPPTFMHDTNATLSIFTMVTNVQKRNCRDACNIELHEIFLWQWFFSLLVKTTFYYFNSLN